MPMTDLVAADQSAQISAAIQAARSARRPLYIRAGNSKAQLVGRHCPAQPLDIAGHRGIIDYQSAELVITARAATPLAEISQLLAAQDQVLPFEPPGFDGRATIGGTLACNLSGPARPWQGSVRDAVLGLKLINGKGELLSFGGQVMKNVAGYDVSRLQAGALGTLGVLSEISLKVLPRPEHSLTLAYEMDASQAVAAMNRRAGESRPLTGACWHDGRLYLRLSGAASAVEHTVTLWGGERLPPDSALWQELGDMSLPFFAGDAALWRLSVKSSAAPAPANGDTLIDWCGAQRWLRGDQDPEQLQAWAAANGGHAALFRGGNRQAEVRQPLDAVSQRLQLRLKQAFDPDGILNPGRLYSWM